MKIAQAVFRWRTPIAGAVIAGVIFAGNIYGWLTQASRVTPATEAAIESGASLNLTITLPFAPEQFHLNTFQRYGSVGGVRGNTVAVRRVQPARARELGRLYWIKSIDLEARRS